MFPGSVDARAKINISGLQPPLVSSFEVICLVRSCAGDAKAVPAMAASPIMESRMFPRGIKRANITI
jgi:hypothetical protein